MERFKQIKEALVSCIQAQVGQGLHTVDTKELGEAIDMLKDMEEAMYYCSIVEAMEESKEDEKYKEKFSRIYPPHYSMKNYEDERMYYDGGRAGGMNNRMYYDGNRPHMGYPKEGYYPYPEEMRDYREGKSPITRRTYMESKELHHDKAKQMQELDKYMKELTDDILEMINGATPEERQMLSQKLTTLATKVQ